MAILRNMIVASLAVTLMPFYGDMLSAIAQFSAKSLMPVLLSSLGLSTYLDVS